MLQELLANALAPRVRTSGAIWLAALTRPSLAGFAVLSQERDIGAARSYAWVLAGALIGAAIQSLPPLEAQLVADGSIDPLLVAFIPIAALIVAAYLTVFTWCAQRAARLLKGSGSYRQLANLFAAFSAPLLIVASVLDLIPPARLLLVVVYGYWFALYVLAIRAVNGLSAAKALAAALLALLALGAVGLAAVFLLVWV